MPNNLTLKENNRQILREIFQKSDKGQILVAVTTSIFQFVWYSTAFIFLVDYILILFFGHLITLLIPLILVLTRHRTKIRGNVINFVALSLMSALCLFAVTICAKERLDIFVFGAIIILFGIGAVGLWSIKYSVFFVIISLAYNFTLYLFIGSLSLTDYFLKCFLPMFAAGLAGIFVLRMRLFGLIKEMEMSRKLKKAKIDLETQKNKLKSELDFLIYSISHDLRSPILSVKGLLMLINDYEKLNSEQSAYLKMADGSIERLDQTIFDILDYADNARKELKSESFNIREMVQEIFDDLKFLQKTPISFYIEIEGSDFIKADRKRLKTIIKNLASNAVKYSRKDLKDSFVKFKLWQDAYNVEFEIEDNGAGIPEEQQEKIFEMFYRYATDISGSGLGLFIVKEVLAKIDGSIALESEPGKGSTFKVAVPMEVKIDYKSTKMAIA